MFVLPENIDIEKFQDFWDKTPNKIRNLLLDNIKAIITVDSKDPKLDNKRAILIGDKLYLPDDSELEEIWHEVGHIALDQLSEEGRDYLDKLVNFGEGFKGIDPEEKLSEDLYFLLKDNKPSKFWNDWLTEESNMKTASVSPIDLVDAILNELAILVINSNDEKYIWMWEAAKAAVDDIQKEDRFSYENRTAPHQYYYDEDLDQLSTQPKAHQRNPLAEERTESGVRNDRSTSKGLV